MAIHYNDTVLEHFLNPRNAGKLDAADGVGEHSSDVCGDHMCVYIAVDGERIAAIGFLSQGCAASIASGSMLTEMAKGRTLAEAAAITREDIARALGGLPDQKIHCSVLAADALCKAIDDYRARTGRPASSLAGPAERRPV